MALADESRWCRPSTLVTARAGRAQGALTTEEVDMAPIRVHEFITLDGVIEAPTWTFEYGFDPAAGAAIARIMGGCDRILLGRTTYQMFEPAWSPRTAEEDPGAPFMNDSTKYVVSSTLTTPSWRNSEIVGPYAPEAIRRV